MIEAFGNLQDGKLYPRIFFWKNISLNTRDHKRHNLFYMFWHNFYWIFAEGLCTCSFYVSFIHFKRPSKPETITILELMLADACVSLLALVVETKNKQPSKWRAAETFIVVSSSLPPNTQECVCMRLLFLFFGCNSWKNHVPIQRVSFQLVTWSCISCWIVCDWTLTYSFPFGLMEFLQNPNPWWLFSTEKKKQYITRRQGPLDKKIALWSLDCCFCGTFNFLL